MLFRSWGGLADYVKEIREVHHNHFVLILDPGIKDLNYYPGEEYPAHQTGVKNDVFIKSGKFNKYDKNLSKYATGTVWPGIVNYPDFTSEVTKKWWAENIENFLMGIFF